MYSEGMESYGLYEDLSLFNGDLLLEDVSEQLPVVANQGLKDELPIHEAVKAPTVKVSGQLALAQPQNGSQELGLQDLLTASPTQDLPDPFTATSAWLDTNTDLVDILTGEVQHVQQQQVVVASSPPPPVASSQDTSIESLEAIQTMLLSDLPMDTTTPSLVNADWSGSSVVYNPEVLPQQPSNADIDILEELNQAGLEQLLASAPDPNTASLIDVPVLSPVSADDIESLLSSSPPSPSEEQTLSSLFESFTSSSSNNVTLDSKDVEEVLYRGPQRPVREKARTTPYTLSSTPSPSRPVSSRKSKVEDRRERKKQQNRTAALRYREKKRSQQDILEQEADELQKKNTALRDKVESIKKEMKYLKDLMAEVQRERSKVKKKGGAF